jgi:hypothetical protein
MSKLTDTQLIILSAAQQNISSIRPLVAEGEQLFRKMTPRNDIMDLHSRKVVFVEGLEGVTYSLRSGIKARSSW